MDKIHYNISGRVAHHSSAWIGEGQDLTEALRDDIFESIDVDLEVTIEETTMHLAAWLDPEHWKEDWDPIIAQTLEEGDEVPTPTDFVYSLLENAVTSD